MFFLAYGLRPTAYGLEVRRISYAPPKNQKKRWPTQAQMGDGSHANVENTDADHSRCDRLAFEPNPANEPLGKVQSLLELNYELNVSTRDRPAKTGADARIEESEANGELRLALRPYGR